MIKDCTHRKDPRSIHNIGEIETIEDMARSMPKINATLDDRQMDHQSTVAEVAGKFNHRTISILIYPRQSHSYVTTRIMEECCLKKNKHPKSRLVQLATGTKRKVSEIINEYPINLNGTMSKVNLNILPLGSYGFLVGMD